MITKNLKSKIKNSEGGFTALFVTLLVLAAVFSIGASIFILAHGEQKIAVNIVKSAQAYYAAESGLEDAILRIKNSLNIQSNYDLIVGEASTTVSADSPSQNNWLIISAGEKNSVFRKIEAQLNINSVIPEFFYGAQVGDLGMEMENGSRIEGAGGTVGNIYSNGSISGGNGATITGTAIVAGSNSLEDVVVNGDAYAHTINNTNICGNAYYQAIDSSSLNFLNNPSGPTCSDSLTPGVANPGSSDPPLQNMPISESNINQWKQEAESGGVYNGNLNISSSMSYGPKKINGNLVMTSNNKTLTVEGAIYVTGYIDISNGSKIYCSPSLGLSSCVVIADQWIHLENNGVFRGSGQPGSYVMLLSTSVCDGTAGANCTDHNAAIDLRNGTAGTIFYANDGLIYLHNGVQVSELIAKKIHLDNNAIIRYEQGLANANFSAGPGGGWEVISWKEIQ